LKRAFDHTLSRLTSGTSYGTLIWNEMFLFNVEYIDSGQEVRGKVDRVGEKGYRPIQNTVGTVQKANAAQREWLPLTTLLLLSPVLD
jgi:hypothetical protein